VTSITFIHQKIERVIDQFIEHNREKIYILYLGDLDPFGWDMDRQAMQDLARQTRGLTDKDGRPAASRFVFKRIGVTDKQIKKFGLEHLKQTDPETLKKLMSKKNLAERFRRQFGSVFQIELEAFDLIPFSKFQKLITDEIDKLYNEDVYQEVLKRPEYSQEPREIKDQIIEALDDLIERLKE
jgi:hypothetical protein